MAACAAEGAAVESLAVDTWGVDFGLLAADAACSACPSPTANRATPGPWSGFFGIVPRERLYDRTGIQFLPFNSVFQLQALRENNTALLGAADRFLMIARIFSPTSCRNQDQRGHHRLHVPAPRSPPQGLGARPPSKRSGSGLPSSALRLIPGRLSGRSCRDRPRRRGCRRSPSWPRPATTPPRPWPPSGRRRRLAYISSGTWSLIGIEAAAPILNAESRRLNFTNEGGWGDHPLPERTSPACGLSSSAAGNGTPIGP